MDEKKQQAILYLQDEIQLIRMELQRKEERLLKLEASGSESTDNGGDNVDIEKEDEPFELKIIYQGQGDATPTKGDVAKIHFSIALSTDPDQIIEESRERYNVMPFSFIIGNGQVLSGFERAVMQMQRGQVVEFLLPANLAYGGDGFGDVIPAHQALYCHIELIEFYEALIPERPLMVQLKPPRRNSNDTFRNTNL
jgi:FKBP-type peptidyl-prolyl cis-trans isomerase